MKSFNQETKDELVDEIIKHRKADQIIQGTYGEEREGEWKGCAVGCAIHSLNIKKGKNFRTSDHSVYESELGIPRILARLEDRIFEGLSVAESKTWPEKFMSAVPVDTDLSLVWPKFAVWLLVDETDGVLKYAKGEKSITSIKRVAELYQKQIDGENVDKQAWRDAGADAYAVAVAAADAYAVAAAYGAAAYAYAVADAYAYAVAAAAYAAGAAAYGAAYAARRVHYGKCAAKLIEILESTKSDEK